MKLILMNGHTGCFKTTFSKIMEKNLGFARLSTHDFKGDIFSNKDFNEEKRLFRYQELLKITESKMIENKDVVLDATFIKLQWRKLFYDLAKKYNYQVSVIRCICSDRSLVKERIESRITNAPEHEAKQFYLYDQLLKEDQPPFDDYAVHKGKVDLTVFDTASQKILVQYGQSERIKETKELLFKTVMLWCAESMKQELIL